VKPILPPEQTILPTLPRSGNIPRITGETLVNVLSGRYDSNFKSFLVLDCRYPYEFEGGHIRGAMNATAPDFSFSRFFSNQSEDFLMVFHCEFSHNRGPQIAGLFRELDRDLNRHSYPNLFYPHVYVLDGGYREFETDHSEWCIGGYTAMLDEEHRRNGDLLRETAAFKKAVDRLEREHRGEQAELKNNGKHEVLMSPVPFGRQADSPITSRMLNFLASPISTRQL
jgi:M-phase inducer tyrosine phosphatase